MAEFFDWRSADRTQAVQRAIQALSEGQLVVLPSESTYLLAAADDPRSLARLSPLAGSLEFTLGLSHRRAVEQIGPHQPVLGQRLLSRCWPGPVRLVLADGLYGPTGLCSESAAALFGPSAGITCRVPAHAAVAEILERANGLVLLASCPDGPFEESALPPAWLESAAIAIQDGPTAYQGPDSIVAIQADGVATLREGVVPAWRLRRLVAEVITFVCTGNTCRSPLAEALCKKMLADALHCGVDDLPDRGFVVMSAGIAADHGGSAAAAAIQVAQELGANLQDHSSQPLTVELARLSDRLIVMTREHRAVLLDYWPEYREKTRMLCDPTDVSDPIGHGIERYRQCADQISQCLRRLVDEIAPAEKFSR